MSYTIQDEREYISGEAHFFKGELYRLKVIRNKACTHHVEIRGDYIIIYVSEHTSKENIANVLWTWYKEQLTPITERLVYKWEQILGVKHHIDILKAKQEEIESLIQEMTEEHEDDFNGYDKVNEIRAAYKSATCKKPIKGEKEFLLTLADMPSNNKNAKLARNSFIAEHQDVFAGWEKFNKADIKRRIGEIENYHPLLPDTLAVFKEYLDKYDELTSLKVQIKELTTTLTNKVVEKYASLTEDEIRTLVVERKWLATVIGGCMALMQSVTHRIGTEVALLVERYENTLPELTKEVSEYENEVNGHLAEMGFTL